MLSHPLLHFAFVNNPKMEKEGGCMQGMEQLKK